MTIQRLGPYEIRRKLGRGGMGTVYEGVNLETGEAAAIKLLSAAHEQDFRQRFEVEIETLRKLNHPNIVRLFGFGEQGEQLFYAMELVTGHSLEEELRNGRRFDWREATRIGIETCRALRHAHDRGVVHRDIKPGNLLLTPDGQVKLSDFGIARLFGGTVLTGAGGVLGTAEYMSPEQAESRPVGPRADLYSLGAVLYVLLARRPLFRAGSFAEMLQKQRTEQPDPLGECAAEVPVELEQIVHQLLEKEPDRRVLNATILARRLESMQRGLSLTAPEAAAGAAGVDASGGSAAGPRNDAPQLTLTVTASDDVRKPASAVANESLAPPSGPLSAAFDVRADGDGPESLPPGRFTSVPQEELDRVEMGMPSGPGISLHTVGLILGLLLVGLAVWYLLRPPSADALYARISARAADGNGASLAQAEDDVRQFLHRFPDEDRAAELQDYQKEIELYRLDRKFDLRAKGMNTPKALVPVEQAYFDAISDARLDPERGAMKLQALVDLYEPQAAPSGPAAQCLELARRRLVQVRQQLAKQRIELQAALRERLDEADRLRPSDRQRAEAMYRAVIELYAERRWAADSVERARAALRKGEKTVAPSQN